MASAGKRVLIIVENLPVPFDRRVWQEATTLQRHGYQVSVICPQMGEHTTKFEVIDGVKIYRHPLPEASTMGGYLLEYVCALFWQTLLTWRIFFRDGFDIIHACNPPDLIFLVALPFKILFGKRFVFDHHDICPELYIAKYGKQDLFYRMLCLVEGATFRLANISIATNESYRKIAIDRGGMSPENAHVVRSGPMLSRLKAVPPVEHHKGGKNFLIGYVGVIGPQEGIDHLLHAISHLGQRRNDFHVAVIGSGPALEEMQALSGKLGLNELVTFYGRVSDEVLLEVLSTSDVCVNPDVANEMNDKSTMNKIMEYMALAKPIVQYDLTEGRFSALEASVYANRNDPKDFALKIEELMDDSQKRIEMGEFGRQRVAKELSWEYESPKLIRAYELL